MKFKLVETTYKSELGIHLLADKSNRKNKILAIKKNRSQRSN